MATWAAEAAELPDTVLYRLVAGRQPTDRWRVSVALPPSGEEGPFHVLYLLDGFLTFVVAAQIARTTRSFSLGQLRPVAVVGNSPDTDDPGRLVAQRARDLTPTDATSPYLRAEPAYGTGGADAMLDLIHEVIAPHVEAIHSIDPADRALGGFSLGGLMTCWTLLRRPKGFRRFLAVSPSLWWDDHLLLDDLRSPIAERDASDVYLAVGEREDSPDRSWPIMPADMRKDFSGLDMVADLTAFTARLRPRPDVDVHTKVLPDEQHATIWPTAITRALIHLYPTDRPAT